MKGRGLGDKFSLESLSLQHLQLHGGAQDVSLLFGFLLPKSLSVEAEVSIGVPSSCQKPTVGSSE